MQFPITKKIAVWTACNKFAGFQSFLCLHLTDKAKHFQKKKWAANTSASSVIRKGEFCLGSMCKTVCGQKAVGTSCQHGAHENQTLCL